MTNNNEIQAALDARVALERVEKALAYSGYDCEFETIRAALTAQKRTIGEYLSQSKCGMHNTYNAFRKTDLGSVQVSCPECEITAQQQPVNAELLEACKVALGHMTGGMDGDWKNCDPIVLLRQAISSAEQKAEV